MVPSLLPLIAAIGEVVSANNFKPAALVHRVARVGPVIHVLNRIPCPQMNVKHGTNDNIPELSKEERRARAVEAGQRSRKELEDSGWVYPKEREVLAKAIKRGRKAEKNLRQQTTTSGYLTNVHFQDRELLTKEMEIELAKRVEAGREAAKRLAEFGWESEEERAAMAHKIADGRRAEGRIVLANLGLVSSIAAKVARRFKNFGKTSLTFEDLLQDGYIGLMVAIEGFDWRKGNRFSTYVTNWIRQAIRVAIMDTGDMIRIPQGRRQQIMKLKRAEALYEMEKGSKPTVEQLSKAIGVSEKVGRTVYDLSKQGFAFRELDRPLSGEQRGDSLVSTLRDASNLPSRKLEKEEALERARAELRRDMSTLTPEERRLVEMRYGLSGTEPANFFEIAEAMGYSSDSIARRRTDKAMKKLQSGRPKRKPEEVADIMEALED